MLVVTNDIYELYRVQRIFTTSFLSAFLLLPMTSLCNRAIEPAIEKWKLLIYLRIFILSCDDDIPPLQEVSQIFTVCYRTQLMLERLSALGASYVNLHSLRCT